MKFSLVKMNFKSPVHFGDGPSQEEVTPMCEGDTLFSAVCYGVLSLWGEEELEKMLDSIPFKISSPLPFYKERIFFPWPYGIRCPEEGKVPAFIEKEIFEKLISSDRLPEMDKIKLLQNETIWSMDKEAPEKLWTEKKNERVVLDSLTMRSGVYHVGGIWFDEGSGLYCLIDFEDSSWKDRIKGVFRFLGEEGIGGERSSGFGQFEPEFDEIELYVPKPEEGRWCVTLSPYLPAEEEVKNFEGYYSLVEKRGWIYSLRGRDYRKVSVRHMATGSCFINRKQEGLLKEVNPPNFQEHKVYHYGMPFKVGMEVTPWKEE